MDLFNFNNEMSLCATKNLPNAKRALHFHYELQIGRWEFRCEPEPSLAPLTRSMDLFSYRKCSN